MEGRRRHLIYNQNHVLSGSERNQINNYQGHWYKPVAFWPSDWYYMKGLKVLCSMPAYWDVWKFIVTTANTVRHSITETFTYFWINEPLQNGQKVYKFVFLGVHINSYLSETSQGTWLAEFRILRLIKLMSTGSPSKFGENHK